MGGVMSIAAGAVSAVGSISGGYAQSASYQNQAAAAEYNAKVAELNASIARSSGEVEKTKAAQAAYLAKGRQRAAQAEGGIISSQTGLMLQAQSQAEADEEQLNIGHKSGLESQAFLSEAWNQRFAAKQYRANAKQAVLGGWLGGAGSVLGGVAGGYDYYKKWGSLI